MIDDSATGMISVELSPDRAQRRAFLIYIGSSQSPSRVDPMFVCLDGLTTVELGRGAARSIAFKDHTVARLTIPDRCVSTRHASIDREMTGEDAVYFIEDHASTNATLVDGVAVTGRQVLKPDSVVETGRSLWKFFVGTVEDFERLIAPLYRKEASAPWGTFSLGLLEKSDQLKRVGATKIPVIIHGETGTGKEVWAREIHRMSELSGQYVALNCAAIPAGLVESELFGHRKGAFTGAVQDKQGVVEAANGGTLLLDEIGDMPAEAQAKLLRMLQEGAFVKVGDTKTSYVDVRVIAATNCNLPEMVSRGEFRGDLYARLNGFDLTLPPLRDRREDMGLLIGQILRDGGASDYAISHPAYRALVYYEWPYNIRELYKTLTTAIVLAKQERRIELCHLPEAIRELAEEIGTDAEIVRPPAKANGRPWRRTTEPVKPDPSQLMRPSRKRMTDAELGPILVEALQRTEGNVSAVARELNTTRMQIHRWMKRLDLNADDFRAEPHQQHSSYYGAQDPRHT